MSLIVVDTNIVSYLYKQDTRGALYAPHLLGNEAALSLMTVAELLQWAALRNWGLARVQDLEATITSKYTMLPIDVETCRWWARVSEHNGQRADCPSRRRMRGLRQQPCSTVHR